MVSIYMLFAMLFITLWIFCGNLLVLLAFWFIRQIRSVDNMIIGSLSITDFLLSLSVAPLAIFNLVAPSHMITFVPCILWLSFDVFLSTVSIWHLCAISFERFYCVVFPLKFMFKRKERVRLLIILSWLSGLFITLPLIIMALVDETTIIQTENVEEYFNQTNTNLRNSSFIYVKNNCNFYNVYFSIISIVVSFWLPMILMLLLTGITMIMLNKSKYKLKSYGNHNNRQRKSSYASSSTDRVQSQYYLNSYNTNNSNNINHNLNKKRISNLETESFLMISSVAHNESGSSSPTTSTTKRLLHASDSLDIPNAQKLKLSNSLNELRNSLKNGLYDLTDANKLNVIKESSLSLDKNEISEQNVPVPKAISTTSIKSNNLEVPKLFNSSPKHTRIKIADTSSYQIDTKQNLKSSKKFTVLYNRFTSFKQKLIFNNTNNNINTNPLRNIRNFNYQCKESEAQRRSLIVLVAFIVGYTPLFFLITISWFTTIHLNSNYFVYLTWLGYLSSALNPSLYAWMNRNLKRAFYTILTCKVGNNKNKNLTKQFSMDAIQANARYVGD